MAARTVSFLVPGQQGLLSVTKPGGSTPILIGCLSKFDVSYSKDTLPVSCRQYTGKVPSGKPSESTISFEGFRYIYITGDVATTVSMDELISYIDGAALVFTITVANAQTGDPIYTRPYIIKSLKYSSDNDGLQTYSGELESAGPEVKTAAV